MQQNWDEAMATIVTTLRNTVHVAPKKKGKQPKKCTGIFVHSFDDAVVKLEKKTELNRDTVRDRLNKLLEMGQIILTKSRLVLSKKAAKKTKSKKKALRPVTEVDYSTLITTKPLHSVPMLDGDETWRRQAWPELFDNTDELSVAEFQRREAWSDLYEKYELAS